MVPKNCFCSIALTASGSLTLFALNYVDGTESSAKYAQTLPSYCPRTFTKCLHLETSMLTTIKYRKYMQIWWHVHVRQGNESCDLWGVHFSEAPQRLGPSIVSQSVESSRGATGQCFPRRRVLIAGPAATMLFTTTHQKQPSEWFINEREPAVACVRRITSSIFIQSSDHARVELCPVDPLHPSLIVSPLSSHRTEILFFLHPGYILPDTVNPCERKLTHNQTSALSLAFRPPFWCPKLTEAFNGESLPWTQRNHTPSRNRCDPSLWFTSVPAIVSWPTCEYLPTSCTALSIPQKIREKMPPPEPGKEQGCKNKADSKGV